MTAFFYWFGLVHVAAYALAGFSFAAVLFGDWIIRRFKLKADFIRAAHRMFRERNAKKWSGA
jgi:hypothetical protein